MHSLSTLIINPEQGQMILQTNIRSGLFCQVGVFTYQGSSHKPVELVERIFPFRDPRPIFSMGRAIGLCQREATDPLAADATRKSGLFSHRKKLLRSRQSTTQIWYHCVQTIFVHVEKNIPLRSMTSNSRY